MVDGVPVTDYPFSQLRGQIGVVPQQAVLFAGTLREICSGGNGMPQMKKLAVR